MCKLIVLMFKLIVNVKLLMLMLNFFSFDVTRSATFDAVIKWKQDLDTKVQLPDGSPIPCILLANKVKT